MAVRSTTVGSVRLVTDAVLCGTGPSCARAENYAIKDSLRCGLPALEP